MILRTFRRTHPPIPRDQDFLREFAAIPSDRGSRLPPIERVLGALPATNYDAIVIPGLASDLERVSVARRLGLLQRTHPLLSLLAILAAPVLLLALIAGWLIRRGRRMRHRATTAT